jgi:hypothetical protein
MMRAVLKIAALAEAATLILCGCNENTAPGGSDVTGSIDPSTISNSRIPEDQDAIQHAPVRRLACSTIMDHPHRYDDDAIRLCWLAAQQRAGAN